MGFNALYILIVVGIFCAAINGLLLLAQRELIGRECERSGKLVP